MWNVAMYWNEYVYNFTYEVSRTGACTTGEPFPCGAAWACDGTRAGNATGEGTPCSETCVDDDR